MPFTNRAKLDGIRKTREHRERKHFPVRHPQEPGAMNPGDYFVSGSSLLAPCKSRSASENYWERTSSP